MTILPTIKGKKNRGLAAFSIVEVSVAAAVVGVMFAALLSGLTSAATSLRFSREQTRATQIMVEKLETIRMYRWDKLNMSFVPSNFIATLDCMESSGETKQSGAGTVYQGAVKITTPAIAEVYGPDLKQVTVTLAWQSGGRAIHRQMTTFVSAYGLQSYVP